MTTASPVRRTTGEEAMAQQRPVHQERLIEEEARANIFGSPLILMDVTRQVSTAVPKVDEERHKAPVNQFVHLRELPDASFTDIVSPNADTLYSRLVERVRRSRYTRSSTARGRCRGAAHQVTARVSRA
jgi:hypothetical protein